MNLTFERDQQGKWDSNVKFVPLGTLTTLEAADGVKLRAAFLPLPDGTAPRGTILISQGRTEFLEKYQPLFEGFSARGFAVASLDWRGQGGSERMLPQRRRGYVRDFADFALDMEAMIAEMTRRALPQPWLIYAHSMGGCIAVEAIARDQGRFAAAILSAPMLGIAVPHVVTAVMPYAAGAMTNLGFANNYASGNDNSLAEIAFEEGGITDDRARYAWMQGLIERNPSLGLGGPTWQWVSAAGEAMARVEALPAGSLNLPMLMLSGGKDLIVSNEAIRSFAARHPSAELVNFPEALHDPLYSSKPIADKVWTTVDRFLFQHAPQSVAAPAAAPAKKVGAGQSTLVLGGARSGKTRRALSLAGSVPHCYIATAQAQDPEMQTRIERHQAERGPDWQLREAPLDLVAALKSEDRDGRTVLVDCLTLWLSNLLFADRDWEQECQQLCEALRSADADVVLVSNEVGMGIVPMEALSREFRDAQGLLNQRIAAVCDRVELVTAGMPQLLKG